MFLQSDGVLWWLIILEINRKVRCTGEKPICHTCQSSGHASDVTIFSGYIILSTLTAIRTVHLATGTDQADQQ
jgi:hypothetical protein